MIYCPDINLLFCHFPKTAGQSIDDFLCANFKSIRFEGSGRKHDSLSSAALACRGRGIEFNKVNIITGMRHPHDVVVSLYFHWNKNPKKARRTVREFIHNYGEHPLTRNWTFKKHILVSKSIPRNLHIVKFEPDVKENFRKAMNDIGIKVDLSNFPHRHKTEHKPFMEYYKDQESIDMITNLFRWTFNKGYYEIPKLVGG